MSQSDDLHSRLISSLQAQLEVAKAARGERWERGADGWIYGADSADVIWAPGGQTNTPDTVGTHLLANDPASTIRKIEALLRVVQRHEHTQHQVWGPNYDPDTGELRDAEVDTECAVCGYVNDVCPDLRDLAAGEGIEVDA